MPPARILTIAGSDCSGGAGIQADLKTIAMLGGYGMSAITAITAQNTLGVFAVEVLGARMVTAQIDACVEDIGVDAVKIGMLGSADIAHAVADKLERLNVPVVFDPVMIATSGGLLADDATIEAFARLMSIASLTTPNLPELEALSGLGPIGDEFSMADAAEKVMTNTGARALLAKGGHWPGGFLFGSTQAGKRTDDLIFDCLYSLTPEHGWQEWHFHHPRLDTRHTHGTGCTLASAIATGLGQSMDLPDAVERAGRFVQQALLAAPGFGGGHGPLGHQQVRGVCPPPAAATPPLNPPAGSQSRKIR